MIWVKRGRPDGVKLPCTMTGSRFGMRSARPGGLAAALFAVLGAVALLVLLWRPACDLLSAHAAPSDDPAACCASLGHGDALEAADAAAPGPGGKTLAGPLPLSYLTFAALFALGTPLFARGSLRTRSFYARSARILR